MTSPKKYPGPPPSVPLAEFLSYRDATNDRIARLEQRLHEVEQDVARGRR